MFSFLSPDNSRVALSWWEEDWTGIPLWWGFWVIWSIKKVQLGLNNVVWMKIGKSEEAVESVYVLIRISAMQYSHTKPMYMDINFLFNITLFFFHCKSVIMFNAFQRDATFYEQPWRQPVNHRSTLVTWPKLQVTWLIFHPRHFAMWERGRPLFYG